MYVAMKLIKIQPNFVVIESFLVVQYFPSQTLSFYMVLTL